MASSRLDAASPLPPLRATNSVPKAIASDHDERITDLIERILSAQQHRADSVDDEMEGLLGRSSTSGMDESMGPLTPSELTQLTMLCVRQSSISSNVSNPMNASPMVVSTLSNGFCSVDVETLSCLITLLEKHVSLASRIDVIHEALNVIRSGSSSSNGKMTPVDQWLKPNALGAMRFTTLKLGLEAAAILLFVLASPGMDRRVISEDAIVSSITLMRTNLYKNISPAISNSGHIMMLGRSDTTTAQDLSASANKKRRRSSGGEADGGVLRELQKVYRHIVGLVGMQVVLTERITRLIQSVPLDDQALLTLTSGALYALELEAALLASSAAVHNIQTAAVDMITAVFKKYPRHRDVILEDIFPIMLRLPSSRKALKAFPIRYSSAAFQPLSRSMLSQPSSTADKSVDYIQALSVLILSLIQSCVVRPTYQSVLEEGIENGGSEAEMNLVSGVKGCRDVAFKIAGELLKRCARKGEEGGASEFRPILSNLIDDLMLVVMNPAYPAAETLLVALAKRLSFDLLSASSSSRSGNATMESTYLATAFDALGKICSMEARILALRREKPLSTILPTTEERQRIYCYCKKSDAIDELSVACDRCDHWYHASCVGHTRGSLPEVWICDACVLRVVIHNESVLRSGGDKAVCGVDEFFATRKLLVEHLSTASTVSGTFNDAREYQLAKWVDECERLSKKEHTHDETVTDGESPLDDTRWVCRRLLEQWDRRFQSVASFPDRVMLSLSDEGLFRSAISLASKCELSQSFTSHLGLMVQLMSDDSPPQLRKLALKAVEKVFQADSKLMLQPALMKAVSLKFTDSSISVREAAISIVGSYVAQLPAAADAFHSSLLPCLADPGVSVRKRTVRILHDMLLSNLTYTDRASACAELLARAADPKEDDGVRDLIHELFLKLWLEDGDSDVIDSRTEPPVEPTIDVTSYESKALDYHFDAASPGAEKIVTPTPHKSTQAPTRIATIQSPSLDQTRRHSNGESRKVCPRTKVAAEQMVEVVKAAGSCDNLAFLLRELLRDDSDADKSRKILERLKRQDAAKKQCSQLSDVLFEMLVSVDERRDSFSESFGKQLVAVMRTISMIAEFSPNSVQGKIETILPYLKADNGVSMDEESAIASACCDILFRVIPHLKDNAVERLGLQSVGQDLVNITYKFGSNALSGAIRTLSALAQKAGLGENNVFGKKLFGLAKTFYGYLDKFKTNTTNFGGTAPKTRNNVQRALNVLGGICRHHLSAQDESHRNDDSAPSGEVVATEHLNWSNLPDSCYGMFLLYLQKEDMETKCASLRALGRAIEANPRLLLVIESSGTIDDIMSESSHQEIHIEAICCWRDILLSEERRIESGIAKAQMDAKSDITVTHRISGDQDSEATIVGGILTKYAPRLHALTKSRNQRLRFVALDLLGNLLRQDSPVLCCVPQAVVLTFLLLLLLAPYSRQGLVNPLQTVPHLLALQGDVDSPAIRSLALKLLITEGEKRPEMLRQRMCAGVKQAYLFQRSVYPQKTRVSAIVPVKKGKSTDFECIFGDIFNASLASSKVQRQGLYKSLLGLFERRDSESSEPRVGSKAKEKLEVRHPVDVSLLCFVAEILAHLPYNTALDPLFIIYHISSTAALQGGQLSDRLAAFLRPFGLSSSDEFDESNAGEDSLERASQCKAPSRHKEASPLCHKSFKLTEFAELCAEAAAIVLLLRLKSFLRKVYSLSETRCLEYTPDAKERPFDKTISKPERMPRFDASIPLSVSSDTTGHAYKDALIRQYAEFRRSMRSEASLGIRSPSPDADNVASEKKKRNRDS